jgi:predicted Zn-dependent protease
LRNAYHRVTDMRPFERLLLTVILAFPAVAIAQGCGSLANSYGPFDYRTSKDRLEIVEGAHFTSDVETLRAGATSSVAGDIDYTLRASPNHHRALNAMVNLSVRVQKAKPPGAHYTVDCYFERAFRFAPDDGLVRLIYGVYLSRINRNREAIKVFEDAKKYEANNANVYYNLGLAYLDVKDYPNALENAQTAYRLGAPLPGLRARLKAAGQWREPTQPGDERRATDADGSVKR